MIGSVISSAGGLELAFPRADEWGCETVQFYITNSRTWGVGKLDSDSIARFKKSWAESNVKEVVAHIPYLVNLATKEIALRKRSISRMKTEYGLAKQLGIKYLVLHPGSAVGITKEEGIANTISALKEIIPESFGPPYILLETMAGQGNVLGSTFEEIAQILDTLKRDDVMGACLDTSHVFAAGYDIRGYTGYERTIAKFEKIIGLKRLKTIHINDSKADYSTHVDRHAAPGEGKIGIQTFHAIVRDKRFTEVPQLLEIPPDEDGKMKSISVLKKLREQKEEIK